MSAELVLQKVGIYTMLTKGSETEDRKEVFISHCDINTSFF